MIQQYGSWFGEIETAKSIIDNLTNSCKGYGFIKYYSSEEWQEKGAAVGIREEVGPNGRTVLRAVKKDFQFGRTLGEGSYSTVMAATDRQNNHEYAIKVLDKKHIIKEKKVKYVNIEKDTLKKLTEHPGIVRLYYTFQDMQSLYFVLDLCNNGEFLRVLKRMTTFDEECARFYSAEILDKIDYMHAKGVIHRDLKPENILLDDKMHIKITDFDTAKILELPKERQNDAKGSGHGTSYECSANSEQASSFVGTAEYVSPELLNHKGACKTSDLWALGCIIYQLIVRRPSFKAGNEFLTFQKIINLEYSFPAEFPEVARDLVERLLVSDPLRRLSIEHVKNHKFFEGITWGPELWKQKPPRLQSFALPTQAPAKTGGSPNGNGNSFLPNNSSSHSTAPTRFDGVISNGASRPGPRLITELPPPSQLDIAWSPVLTNTNERILKLGNLLVLSSPAPHSPNSRNGVSNSDAETPGKKFSRFFGNSAPKKCQRLVMVTSSARIVTAAAGGGLAAAEKCIRGFHSQGYVAKLVQLGHNVLKMPMSTKTIRFLILFYLITPAGARLARLEEEAYVIQRMYYWGGAASVFALIVAVIAFVCGVLAWLRLRPVVARRQDRRRRFTWRRRVGRRAANPPPRNDPLVEEEVEELNDEACVAS